MTTNAVQAPLIYTELLSTQELFFDPCGLNYSMPVAETESSDYAACTFNINESLIRYRRARVTPAKNGQFLTLWKRADNGIIAPFDDTDPIEFYLVATQLGQEAGLFIFPKEELLQQGILAGKNNPGKRGFRVYPSWDKTCSRQAFNTQQWQSQYFVRNTNGKAGNGERIKHLLGKQ